MSLDTVWNSYISADAKPATVKRGVLGGGGGAQAKLSEAPVTQELPNEDTTWHTVNAASAKLIKRTGQPELAKKLEQDNQEDANKRAETKVGRPPKSKKALVAPAPPTAAPIAVPPVGGTAAQPRREQVLTSVSNGIMQETLPIHTLEQHTRRDNQAELFALKIERPHRPTADMIVNTPPASEVLKYVATHWREEMSWYDKQIKLVANNPHLTFQSVPLFIREVLQTFLRAPDPTVRWERPCYNLDREPLPHEGRIRCIAHRLSEKQTGKGYRLRELLFNDQSVKINAAAASGSAGGKPPIDPTIYLSTVPEMCFLCHIYMTTHACFNLKNRLEEKELNDLTSRPAPQAENDDLYIMNRFCVDVDKPGEYDRRKMLCTDDVSMGIWGCFPMWNERHYIACMVSPTGGGGGVLPGFAETDELLFRLPRVPLQVTDSSKQSDSIQFTLSSVGQANLTSRQ
jgi:hypothetical protein